MQEKYIIVTNLEIVIKKFGKILRNFFMCLHNCQNFPLNINIINDTKDVKQVYAYNFTLKVFKANIICEIG